MLPVIIFPYWINFVGEVFLVPALMLTLYYNYLCYELYNFTKNKSHVKKRFKLFKPLYIDSYDLQFRNEGSEKRFTFCGIKE